MKKIKLVKLDKRHTGYSDWLWYVERPNIFPIKESKKLFYEWRHWCWDQWGPSKELNEFEVDDLFDGLNSSNNHWCWLNDQHNRSRIYLRTDQDASMFSFRWI